MAVGIEGFTQGFSYGDTFEVIELSSRVELECRARYGRVTRQIFYCRDQFLSPSDWDHFVFEGVDADEVELTATYENGDMRTKKEDFDAAKGRTEDRVNLWIGTLFQRPLLSFGHNEISYKMLKQDQTVEEGNFSVQVRLGERRFCRNGYYHTRDPHRCHTSNDEICNFHYRRQNWCR